jgi:hypothetical protein
VGERALAVESDRAYPAPVGFVRIEEVVVEISPARAIAPTPLADRASDAAVVPLAALQSSLARRPQTEAIDLTLVSAEHAGAGPEAAVPGTPTERLNPLPPSLDNLAFAPVVHLEAQGLSAGGSLVGTEREEEGPFSLPEPWRRDPLSSPRAVPPLATVPEEQAEEGWALLSPQVACVLTWLPPRDLSALERGMQQFLGQLEQMGEELAGHRDGTALLLWVVALAAAGTAGELARRQLRRPAGPPPDHLFAV